jgi:hypothetical protein
MLFAWSDPESIFYHVDDPKIRAIAARESTSRNIASSFLLFAALPNHAT